MGRPSGVPVGSLPAGWAAHSAISFNHNHLESVEIICIAVWDDPEEFQPERFPLDGPVPNEQNTDYRYIPFSAGPRCATERLAG